MQTTGVPVSFDALLLDMDGVLYHGSQALPDAQRFLGCVVEFPYLFITNNPIATPQQLSRRLQDMGLGDHPPERFLTSALATAEYLRLRRPDFCFYAVGASGLSEALCAAGGVADSQKADFVVVGEGAGLDYEALTQGVNLILQRGAELISTNPDQTVDAWVDGEHRVLPGGGALVAPFERACSVNATTIGKPQPLLYQMALHQLGVKPDACVMVGDRPDTDIHGAKQLGMQAALVRTGRFGAEARLPEGMARPNWDVASLSALMDVWGWHG